MPTVDNFNRNLALMVVLSLLSVLIIQYSTFVYLPPMLILAFSFFGGVLEPRKGWILALIQIAIIIASYWMLKTTKWMTPSNEEAAFFATHSSPLATLSASFMGALIKKM